MIYSSLLVSHDRDARYLAHFKQLHSTGKSCGITYFVVIVRTNISSSVNSYQ